MNGIVGGSKTSNMGKRSNQSNLLFTINVLYYFCEIIYKDIIPHIFNITTCMEHIVISNQRICRFYQENPTINCEAVNLIFIDLFDKLLTDMNSTMNISINSEILSNMNEIKHSITNLKDSVSTMNQNITNTLLLNFEKIKKEYINELNTIVQHNTHDKIGPLIEKNNHMLIDRTTCIMNEIIPKSQNHYYTQIHESIRSFHKSISDDTRILLKYTDNSGIKDYLNNFEMKSSMMLQNMQQPIYSFITSSEERINMNISNLKENNNNNTAVQTKILGELTEILNNYKQTPGSPHSKNNTQINVLLNKIYSTAEIVPIHKTIPFSNNFMSSSSPSNENSSKFLIKRASKAKVLIYCMNIDRNISIEENEECLKSLEEHGCHCVFVSQNSGFSQKPNYHIDTYNNKIVVYVHDVENYHDKIAWAVDIIDNLSNKLKEYKTDNEYECTIDKDVLEEINKEYQQFINQKETITALIKDSQKKILSSMEDFKIPALDKFLSTKFAATIHKQGFKCELCKIFNANNLKALAAHKRGCSRKNIIMDNAHVTLQNNTISS